MTPPPASAERLRAGIAAPAPLRLPPAPRRVSGPARRERAAERPVSGFSAFVIALIDHPWLERLVRGRAWIAIVATALLGIVAMQVALLRLGAQVGAQTAAVNAMIQRNEATMATIGGLEASIGLGAPASSLGMLYPPPGAVTYLQPNPGDARRAAERMQVPTAAASAAAAAHPLRETTTASVYTTTTGGATAAVNPPSTNAAATPSSTTIPTGTFTGATGAAGTAAVPTATTQSNGTSTAASGAAATTTTPGRTTSGAPSTTATTAATTGSAATTPSTTTRTAAATAGTTTAGTAPPGTAPPTTAAGGAAAATDAGGTSAPTTGATSGASVAPSATSAGG